MKNKPTPQLEEWQIRIGGIIANLEEIVDADNPDIQADDRIAVPLMAVMEELSEIKNEMIKKLKK